MSEKKTNNKYKIFLFPLTVIIVLIGSYLFVFHTPNTNFENEFYDQYIYKDSLVKDELNLELNQVVKLKWTFNIASFFMNLKCREGLHLIPRKSSNYDLIKELQSEQAVAVKATIGNMRFRQNVTSRFCKGLDLRSRALGRELWNDEFIKSLDSTFNKENVYSIFFQDSLWVYRNTTAKDLVKRQYRNWKEFWTAERKLLAKNQGLTPKEVMILASIVQAESQDLDELPIIAGLYLNRLRQDMKLQADPTVVYAWQKGIRRVLKKHLKIRSKYNTYKYKGLPPGPVFIPTKTAIDAVLNPSKHDFLFFVANPLLDGKHDFSKTYKEHLEKARSYRNKLNQKKIYR